MMLGLILLALAQDPAPKMPCKLITGPVRYEPDVRSGYWIFYPDATQVKGVALSEVGWKTLLDGWGRSKSREDSINRIVTQCETHPECPTRIVGTERRSDLGFHGSYDLAMALADEALVFGCLGDPRYKLRVQAQRALTSRGRMAIPAVTNGLKSKDAEVAARCQVLIWQAQGKRDEPWVD